MNEAKKTEVWNYMMALPKNYRPRGLTNARIEKLKTLIWNDNNFWSDIILRHGLKAMTLEQLKESGLDIYNHCVGNFWSMLFQTAIEHGIIK